MLHPEGQLQFVIMNTVSKFIHKNSIRLDNLINKTRG